MEDRIQRHFIVFHGSSSTLSTQYLSGLLYLILSAKFLDNGINMVVFGTQLKSPRVSMT